MSFPIAEQQIGAVAYLFGILNNGTPIAMTGVPTFTQDSDELTSTWKEKENTDTQGNVQNLTQTNFKYERMVKFKPTGATRAAAANIVGDVLALNVLIVANHEVPAFNGTWRVRPGTKVNLKMDDDADIEIPVELYLNSAQNAALTSAPIVG